MTDIFIKLLNMSIVAGWLVIAVLLLRLALRKAPRWIFCVLWAFVALRLLIPFSVQSKTSAVPSVETVPPEIVYTDTPYIHSGLDTFNSVFNPIISDVLSPPETDSVIETEPKETPAKKLIDIGATVWLCGTAGMSVYGLASYALLKRRVREAVKQDKRIFICDNVSSPFILGAFCPRIYLPSYVSEADAEMVIAHEQAHIKRKDHLWKPFGFLLLTVYWFNPLLWVAYVMFCKDIESACDEKVIKKYGLQIKKQYSEALLNCSVSGKWVTACPVAFGETSVKSRIKGVLNYKKPAFWIIIIAVLACIATSLFFLTDPLSKETSGDILPKLEYEAYTYTLDSESPYPREVATVYLEKSGNHFTYGYETYILQEYCPYGTYRKDGGKLYLETADGKNTYVFNIKNKSIEYVAELSSQLPMTKINPEHKLEFAADNTVFVKETKIVIGEYAHVSYLVFQSAFKDVDGDRQKELCVISDGPTSGISSTLLAIYDGCDHTISEMITFETVRFVTGTDGSVQLVFGSETNARYDFRITDEGIICTNAETGEEKPFSEMERMQQ